MRQGRRPRRRSARPRGGRCAAGARRAHDRRCRWARTSCRRSSTSAAARRCGGSSTSSASASALNAMTTQHPPAPPRRRGSASTSPTAAASTRTSSSSPRACGRATSSARASGLEIGERGGDRRRRHLPDQRPRHLAVGEVACIEGAVHRARRPRATRWPRSPPTGCSAATATFPGSDTATKLKLSGVDVASFGDAFAADARRARGRLRRPGGAASTRSSCCPTTRSTLLGGILVGDASRLRDRCARCVGGALRRRPGRVPAARGRRRRARPASCPTTRSSARATASRPGRSAARCTEDGCTDVARGQGVHQGRHRLRLVPAAGQEARRHRAREAGRRASAPRCASTSPCPARSCSTPSACRGCSTFSAGHRAVRHRPRLRHLQAGARAHPVDARPRRTCSTASTRRCRTPTTT